MFYFTSRLPQDVYQTAKIAKLLLIIDKGEGHKYKGKDLKDITVEETDCLEVEKENITGIIIMSTKSFQGSRDCRQK